VHFLDDMSRFRVFCVSVIIAYFTSALIGTSITQMTGCCLERLVSEMTYYVLSGTLNPTHSLNLSASLVNSYKSTVRFIVCGCPDGHLSDDAICILAASELVEGHGQRGRSKPGAWV